MLPRLRGLNFYIVINREMLIKFSSQELLHQIGQYPYLVWIIPGTRVYQVCSNKVPGIINGHALMGHSVI